MHGPRLSEDPQWASHLTQVFKSFNKRYKLSQIPLPNVSKVYRIVCNSRFMWSGVNGLVVWGFWTGLTLGLRSGELFLLRREYIDLVHMNIIWPKDAPIKGGFIRKLYPYQLPIIKMFIRQQKNPFLVLTQKYANSFLSRFLSCTLRSMRHCGAFVMLDKTKNISAVANGLGHQGIICTMYYIDPWSMPVSFELISDQLAQVLRKQ